MASEKMMEINPRILLGFIRMIEGAVAIISSDDSLSPDNEDFSWLVERHLRISGNSIYGMTDRGILYLLDDPKVLGEADEGISFRLIFSIPSKLVRQEESVLLSAHSLLPQ